MFIEYWHLLKTELPKYERSISSEQFLHAETDTSPLTLPPGPGILQAWFRRSVEQLRKDSTVVIRILLDVDPAATRPFHPMSWVYWSDWGYLIDTKFWALKHQIVFVLPPQYADLFRRFISSQARTYSGFRFEYTVETSNGSAQN